MNSLSELYQEEYGEEIGEELVSIVLDIQEHSNFKFTSEYFRIANSFLSIKADEILNGEKKKISLRDLVSQSYGEAAIYYFQS